MVIQYDILMNLTHSEGKSVVSERFIRTLKGKVYKKLQVIILNTYHLSISKTPIDAKKEIEFKVKLN